MAKKARGSYKCGKCGNTGHNARKCPTKGKAPAKTAPTKVETPTAETPTAVVVSPLVAVPVVETVDDAAPAPVPDPIGTVAMHTNQDISINYDKDSARPARPPAPFECPTCNQVGVLALLEMENGTKVLRCEHCYTKANPKLILKWGALPGDKPAGTLQNWGVNAPRG